MPTRSRKPADSNQLAAAILHEATDGPEIKPRAKPKKKNPAAVALGKLGGRKGGLARSRKLTAERRHEIASRAARARWAKKATKKKGAKLDSPAP